MPAAREKKKIQRVIQSLPDDAHIEDAMECLYLLYKVETDYWKAFNIFCKVPSKKRNNHQFGIPICAVRY